MFEVAIVDGLSRVGHKCADWISDDSWVLNLLGVATMIGGTEWIGLPECHLVELSTLNCRSKFDYQFPRPIIDYVLLCRFLCQSCF